MDLADSSAEGKHLATVYDLVSGLLVMAAFASGCVFLCAICASDVCIVHAEFCAVDGGPQASMKVESWRIGCRVRDKILVSFIC